MKRSLRNLCLILTAIITVTLCMPLFAKAETNYNLKIKGSVNLTNASYLTGENFCRIFVEEKGYLTLTVNSGSEVSYMFCDSNKSAIFTNRDCLNDISGRKITYAVDRGSYYLSQISSKGNNVKLSATFSTGYKLSKDKKTTVYSRNCGQYFYLIVIPDVPVCLIYTVPPVHPETSPYAIVKKNLYPARKNWNTVSIKHLHLVFRKRKLTISASNHKMPYRSNIQQKLIRIPVRPVGRMELS